MGFDFEHPERPTLRGQPDEEAIRMIREFEPLALQNDPRGYCVCSSEGKDSRVLGHLMRRAKVRHFYLHSITGIDPPELIYFQRRNFQTYQDLGYLTYDVMYELSIWQLLQKKRIPPLRQLRYCCEYLKERRTPEQASALLSLGVRKYESAKRAKQRDEMEIAAHGKKGKNIILPFDNGENRRTFEYCYAQAEKRLNPLAYWPDSYIWDYSHEAHLEQCSLYQEGFTRLGCIGCPMAREQGRRMEFVRWPKFEEQWVRSLDKLAALRVSLGLEQRFASGREWFEWWLSDVAQEQPPDENQLLMEAFDFGKGGTQHVF